MFRNKKMKKTTIIIMILLLTSITTACKEEGKKTLTDGKEVAGLYENEKEETEEKAIENLSEYNDLAVVKNINVENKEITLRFISNNKDVMLSYSGATTVFSKYDNHMTMAQLETGKIVTAEYKKGTQKLTTIKEYSEAWSMTDVVNFRISVEDNIIKIGASDYNFEEEDLLVISEEQIKEIKDIETVDVLNINGIGKKIYSINIKTGHGYLVIENQDYFIGGMIEIGDKIIKEITSEMKIAVPEGDYVLKATKAKISGSTEIKVLRNETLTVDISSLQGELTQKGSVKFKITPETATLYIDGENRNIEELAVLSYGRHTIMVYLEGYKTYSEVINVEESYTEKTIGLYPNEE